MLPSTEQAAWQGRRLSQMVLHRPNAYPILCDPYQPALPQRVQFTITDTVTVSAIHGVVATETAAHDQRVHSVDSHGFEHIDPQSRVLNYCFQ